MKILLVTPTSDGTDVGEAWVSYQWASRLVERADVTILTYHKRDRPSLRSQLPGARIIEWTEPPLLGRQERLNSLLKPGYAPFYWRCRRWIARARAAGERFDVGFQPTPVAMRYPSPLAGSGIPYVVGPVGGSLADPPGFADADTAPWYVGLRRLDAARLRADPLLRASYVGAACVVGIAPYVGEFLSGLPLRRFEVMAETGLTELPAPVDRSGREGQPVRLLFVGRLVRTKGVRDLVQSLDHLRDLDLVLDVVGDGFDRAACEQLATDLGVHDRVTFHGRLPFEALGEFYRAADLFAFPSYREPGGNAFFEAMGYGLPLIVADRGGPAGSVDDSCALYVTPTDPLDYARRIADAVRTLAVDAALRARMGAAARVRAEHVGMWDAKVGQMLELLASVAR